MQDCGSSTLEMTQPIPFGSPRQGCGQFVDLSFAGKEAELGTRHWAPGAGPWAGQNPATFVWLCIFSGFGWHPWGGEQASEESLEWR